MRTNDSPLRKSQRAPKSCKECSRRKIKCDKIVPCRPCLERGEAEKCSREVVFVKGRLLNSDTDSVSIGGEETLEQELARLRLENETLRKQLTTRQECVSAKSSPAILQEGVLQMEAVLYANSKDGVGTEDGNEVKLVAEALEYLVLGLVEEELDSDEGEAEAGYSVSKPSMDGSAYVRRTSCSGSKQRRVDGLIGTRRESLQSACHRQTRRSASASTTPKLSKMQSERVVEFSLSKLGWIHCAVHAPHFWQEHEKYWELRGLRAYEGHEEEIEDHYWKAVWYALVCTGLFFMSEEETAALGFNEHYRCNEQSYSEQFFEASLEELDKAQFMRYPNICSVQTICILSLCFHTYGGLHLHYCLLNTVIYIAQCLNLHRLGTEESWLNRGKDSSNQIVSSLAAPAKGSGFLDREMGRRMWWALVIIDWLSRTGGNSVISPGSFNTALPGNYDDEDLYVESVSTRQQPKNTTTMVSYHIVMAKLAILRKSLETAEGKCWSEKLRKADRELDEIASELPQSLADHRNSTDIGINEICWFQQHLLAMTLATERLRYHMSFSDHKQRKEESRQVCLRAAQVVLEEKRKEVPLMFQKNWNGPSSTVKAGIYFILDRLHNPSLADTESHIQIVEELIDVLRPVEEHNALAKRGINLLQRLLSLVDEKQSQQISCKRRRSEDLEIDLHQIVERINSYPRLSQVSVDAAGTGLRFTNGSLPRGMSSPRNEVQSPSMSLFREGGLNSGRLEALFSTEAWLYNI